jgi:hypothetical protein
LGTTLVEPPKFSPEDLAALLGEAVLWMQQQRESFLPRSKPLTADQKAKLLHFFLPENLDRLRIADISQTGETIPYPPFYERVRAGGSRVVPDAAHMTAIPFIDVAVFNREPTLRTIFHTLVHVVQFSMVGLEKAMKGYFKALDESGLWIVVPYEQQAYELDARFTKDPSDFFSVETEVREWIRAGKF